MLFVRRIAFVLALMCGTVASQMPEFAQQYRQRLGGAIDELSRRLQMFDSGVASQGLDRAGGINRLQANPDPVVRQQGEQTADTEAREARLKRQQEAFSDSGAVGRLFALARDFDPAIASRAYQSFEPAVPLTTEGIVTGVAGFALGYAVLHLAAWPLRRRQRRQKARVSPDGRFA